MYEVSSYQAYQGQGGSFQVISIGKPTENVYKSYLHRKVVLLTPRLPESDDELFLMSLQYFSTSVAGFVSRMDHLLYKT